MREPSDPPLLRGSAASWSFAEGALPVFVYPMHHETGDDASVHAAVRRCASRYLGRVGSILFRGFAVHELARFRAFAASLGPLRGSTSTLLEPPLCAASLGPCRLAAPRAGRAVALHCEHAHAARWPTQHWTWCERAPTGAAPSIADTREVYRLVPKRVRNELIASGITYVRDLGDQPERWPAQLRGLSRAELEAWAHAHALTPTWGPRGAPRLTWRGRVVARHPRTGELVWFNHVHALPTSSRSDATPGLSVCYADGSALEEGLVAEIRAAFLAAAVTIPWEAYDVLLVDNMLTAHALPEEGGRFHIALSEASAGAATPAV
ncbi:MAG: TauD/TfdA family dioxygenase [Polyangiales bacterium]